TRHPDRGGRCRGSRGRSAARDATGCGAVRVRRWWGQTRRGTWQGLGLGAMHLHEYDARVVAGAIASLLALAGVATRRRDWVLRQFPYFHPPPVGRRGVLMFRAVAAVVLAPLPVLTTPLGAQQAGAAPAGPPPGVYLDCRTSCDEDLIRTE